MRGWENPGEEEEDEGTARPILDCVVHGLEFEVT